MSKEHEGSGQPGQPGQPDQPEQLGQWGQWPKEFDTAARWTDEMDAEAEKEFEAERETAIAEAGKLEAENEKVFANGTEGVFARRKNLLPLLRNKREEICDRYVEEAERMPQALAAERQEQRIADAEYMYWGPDKPLWMRISGLFPRAHLVMSPNERAGCIRLLLRRVERMARWALKNQKAEGGTQKAEGGKQKADDGGERSVIEETVLWSPVRSICVYLEIPQRTLSGLCKEITGMSIEQVVDRIKAENLREEFKKRLKDFVRGWLENPENRGAGRKVPGRGAPATVADEIFAALKAERRLRFNRAQWAFELGYSSYQGLFRATLLSFGLTPHQMEIAAIEELLPVDALCSGGQKVTEGRKQKAEGSTGGAEAHIKEERPAEAG